MNQTQEVERPNWVQARANCTLEGTFKQIVDAIQYDTDCFHGLPPDQHKARTITPYPQADTVIFRRHGNGLTPLNEDVSVHIVDMTIQVRRNNSLLFQIHRAWNEQTLTCDLKIDGEVHSLWQISQKAIGDLLFE